MMQDFEKEKFWPKSAHKYDIYSFFVLKLLSTLKSNEK